MSTKRFLSCAIFILLSAFIAGAQTTAFSYQGKLTDAGTPANGSFQMQFKLFDAASGGTQVGTTLVDVPVTVAAGSFSLKLDFGAGVFPGADRWLEVAVRRNSGEGYVTLTPREQVASSPHSIKSLSSSSADGLSASCTSCVTASQIESVDGSQVTGTIPVTSVPTGSDNYIQNASVPRKGGREAAQPGASINIGGNATVGSMNVNGPVSLAAVADPGTSPAGQGRIYFDTTANKIRVSENGGAFVNLVGASGVSGSGTVNKLPFWSAGTTLGDSAVSQSGTNIGIGTTTPNTRLTVSGGVPWTSNGWTASMNLQNISALGWEANASGQRFGIGQTSGGLFFFRTNSPFGNGSSAANYDVTITDAGNVGFGTTTPGSKIELRGASVQQRITDATSGNSLVLQGGAGSNMKVTGYHYGTGTAVPLYLSVDGANTIMNSGGGNVGVGLTNPSTRLSVFSDFYGMSHTDGSATVSTFLNSQGGWFGTTTNHSLHFFTNDGGQLMTITPSGNVGVGTTSPTQKFHVAGTTRTNILQITGGSDLAENFEVTGPLKPGMIVAIDPKNTGKLVVARGAYNRQVAGIISGANNLSAGMLLPDLKEGKDSMPVALSGRVWVYADATKNPIRPGDLLTTSGTAGYAMRVTNYRRAQGSVIGKAMSELKTGTGLVLVLVSLQ